MHRCAAWRLRPASRLPQMVLRSLIKADRKQVADVFAERFWDGDIGRTLVQHIDKPGVLDFVIDIARTPLLDSPVML